MPRAFLLVPKNAMSLACPTCTNVVLGMLADKGTPDVAVALPCEVTGPPIDCALCQFPISQEVTMQ